MANIDDLSINVKSNVTSATNSIDKLIRKLGALSASLGQVNTSGFTQLASGVRQVGAATQTLNGTRAGNLTKTVNEINKFSTINAQQLTQVASAVQTLSYGLGTISNINANTNGINALAISIRKFGATTATQAANNIPRITQALQTLVYSMSNLGNVQINTQGLSNLINAISRLGGTRVGTAITQIPQVTQALQILIYSMAQMGNLNVNTAPLTQLVTAISRLGGVTATRAIQNIPQLTNALVQMINVLSQVPQVNYNTIQLVNALANLASNGARVNTVFNALNNGFNNFGRGAGNARKKAFSLAGAIGKLYANYWLLLRAFRGIGKGIDLASDLTEVQNVVDVSFGQYRDKIEQFADTSIVDYGMSELTAKQIASRYQAMGGAIGFAQGEMADMSIELTKLAADMASFYNVEQSAVAEDLEAIFTGQTRPLREYGLDLTQATLQEWALSQGMEANIATMTQAEKVLLRYNYVLAQTGMAQGDFQRTQGTWANQIRILRQQFEALGAIIGQNFVYALKPVITALNTVMAKLIQFARVVSNSLGKIFGWKYEDTTGGIADDLEFGAEAADDLSSGLGGAADKAKKLKQQLQGFDELNVLATNTPSSSGGGGGGALGDTDVSATGGQWVRDTEEKFFESDLDTLYKLGDHIGTTLTNQLRSIDWQEVYQGAKDFGSGLASFLNGLISPELFSETGKLIAGSLNTIIYTALSFGVTFDFIELGESIGEGINTFFTEFDYKAYAQTFNTWVGGILDGLITAFDTVNWDLVGTAIGDYLKEIDIVGLSTKLLTLAGKILSALGTALVSSFQTAPIETALITIFAGLKLVGIGTALTGALNTALAGGLSISVPKIVATVALLSIIADKASTSYTDDGGSNIWNTGVLSGAAAGIAKILGASNSVAITIGTGVGTAKAGGEIGLSLGEILSIESGDWELADYYANFKWSDLFDYSIDEYIDALDGYTSEFVDWIDDSIVTPSELKQAEKNWGNFGKLIGKDLANKIITTQKALKLLGVDTKKLNSITFDTMNEIKSSKNVWGSLSKAVPQYAETIKDGVTEQWDNLKTSTSNAYTWIKEKVLGETQTTANGMKVAYKSANDSIKITSADTTSDIVAKYKAMRENVVGNSDAMKNSVNRNSNSIKITSADTTSDIVAKYKAMRTDNEKEASTMATNVVGFLTKLKSGAETETKGLDSSLVSKFQNAKTGADTNFKGILNSVNANIGGAKSIVEKQNWYSSGSNLVAGLAKGLSDKWNDTSGSGLVGKIVSLASGLTSALKRAFGIHSPSRLWDEEIGQMLPAGIGKGVLKGEDALNTDIINMGARLTDTMSGALTLATPCGLSSNFDFGVTSTMAHNFSADTSMTSSVADGVRLGLSTTQAEQNALLREQNELLYQILQKESISSDDVYNVVVNKNRDIFNRTGTNPLFA